MLLRAKQYSRLLNSVQNLGTDRMQPCATANGVSICDMVGPCHDAEPMAAVVAAAAAAVAAAGDAVGGVGVEAAVSVSGSTTSQQHQAKVLTALMKPGAPQKGL
jgi:hypothetical protein